MDMPPFVMGVDPSLSGTGVAVLNLSGPEPALVALKTIKTKPEPHPYMRFTRYESIVEGIHQNYLPTLVGNSPVFVESYAMLARGRAVTALPELGGMLRSYWHRTKTPWAEVPPQTIKKFTTGKGNALKDQMVACASQRFAALLLGTGFQLEDNNQADALSLAMLGAEILRWKAGLPIAASVRALLEHLEPERFWQL